MLKKLFLLFISLVCLTLLAVHAVDEQQSVAIKAGTFIKVLNLNEFSSLMADADDELMFLNTQDMYIYETNVIPENTRIYGVVEEVLEPVEGKDGAIKVSIYKMITPDKKVYRVKGHIYSENNNYIGGKETASIYYKKVPHYNFGMKPMLQAVPLNVFEMGKHTVVMPGAELFVILEEDVIAKWTKNFFTRYKK